MPPKKSKNKSTDDENDGIEVTTTDETEVDITPKSCRFCANVQGSASAVETHERSVHPQEYTDAGKE